MAAKEHLPGAAILVAKRQIFNKLCMAYLRFKNSDRVDADELRRELNIPETIFAEALFGFLSGENQMAVQVLEDRGCTYLRLGEAGRDLCADWPAKETRSLLRKAELYLDTPITRLIRRSA
jgi:hypothetical protein